MAKVLNACVDCLLTVPSFSAKLTPEGSKFAESSVWKEFLLLIVRLGISNLH